MTISKGVDYMLGKYVRVRITNPIHSVNRQCGYTYQLNFGTIEGKKRYDSVYYGAYIMGINHPIRTFDGRVIAVIRYQDNRNPLYVVAPKSTHFISHQIEDAVSFAEKPGTYELDCLYERSCGAVVFRFIAGGYRYLLIKNKRSANWGFPKGHIERGETNEQTAIREVLEETGINIEILPDFLIKSDYTIHDRIEKSVVIYLARTNDKQTVIQKEEIEDYVWLDFDKAMKTLRFANDRNVLKSAREYLIQKGII